MKKGVAILLTAILLINLFGYRVIFYFAAEISDTQLEASLDNIAYNEDELITVRVPLNNPYQLNQSDYERIDGEITYEGKLYKYVKRRIFNNELILLCVPNHNKMRIEEQKKNFFENTNDVAQKKQENSKRAVKNPVLEYDHNYFGISLAGESRLLSAVSAENIFRVSAGYLSYKGEPPCLV